jgi:hypothetical protein
MYVSDAGCEHYYLAKRLSRLEIVAAGTEILKSATNETGTVHIMCQWEHRSALLSNPNITI